MQCFKGHGRLKHEELFRVAGRHHFEVHMHVPTFLNYYNARLEYGALREGTKVMCQCRRCAPEDVLKPERNVSCAAVAVYPPPAGWIKSNRGHWICPRCDTARLEPFSCLPAPGDDHVRSIGLHATTTCSDLMSLD